MSVKVRKSFALLILSILCTLFCFGCADANEAFEVVGEPTFTCVYNEETKQYDVDVTGLAQNNGNIAWEMLSVTFALYDEDGYMIGTAIDTVSYVETEGSWRFTATGTTSYPTVSVKLVEFDGYEKN
jgi:hypothetical protein